VATLGPEPGLPGDELLVVLCVVRFPAFTTCMSQHGTAAAATAAAATAPLRVLWAARVLTHESWSETF
jgi:hypothetical protein